MELKRACNRLEKKLANSNASFYLIVCVCVYLLFSIFSSLRTPHVQGVANVPSSHADGKVHIHDMNVLTTSADPQANLEKVLIISPLARFYEGWWNNLISLEYPHDLIDVAVSVPDNLDGDKVLESLQKVVHLYQNTPEKFRRITILRQDTPSLDSQSEKDRHALEVQKERRAYMSLARNSLVFTTMQSDTSWVLWLDGDVVETPKTIIQDMASADKDVIVANCFQKYMENGELKERPYDFNSWAESETALNLAKNMGPDDVLFEGYAELATYRPLMAYMYDKDASTSAVVPLDGVGGTALLVKAEVHRDGAFFPPFSFYHLIETEGFAKMVKRLGYNVFGLPNYKVYHYNE
ncbi:mannosyltransferase complex subunit [Starmerella bacillaris]|uniref:Mannosyltransferase complex subunit n=1 Tax=Starmerella bacillaris TaxID=1247836 RepID=A0AAV5RGG9_STABA|nr:mannosyltransferase complex subunit [Starmerella bacillaris]